MSTGQPASDAQNQKQNKKNKIKAFKKKKKNKNYTNKIIARKVVVKLTLPYNFSQIEELR